MSISFQCEKCGKKIKAPDDSGGKWSKCPGCHNKIYIPDSSSSEEELKLAPIDETHEQRQKRLMNETFKLQQDILLEREETSDISEPLKEISDKQLTVKIITCLRLTADGELEKAEELVDLISGYGNRAIEILDRIALSEIPGPELADIPPQVLSGLIRTLRSEIK